MPPSSAALILLRRGRRREQGDRCSGRRPRRPGLSDAGDRASGREASARALPLASLSRDIGSPGRKGDEEIHARAAVLGGPDCPAPRTAPLKSTRAFGLSGCNPGAAVLGGPDCPTSATEQAAGRLTLRPCRSRLYPATSEIQAGKGTRRSMLRPPSSAALIVRRRRRSKQRGG